MADDDELGRLYGPWHARTPEDAARFFRGYPGRWWVAGGWAIDALTGPGRRHHDLDLGIPRAEVAALQAHVAGRLDVWAAEQGALRPLVEPVDAPLPAACGNLWLRAGGADPWEYDVLLTDVVGGMWTYRRDPCIAHPLDEVTWTRGGILFLRPEVQLLHKAPGLRPKDQEDFAACLPLLGDARREWLATALRVAHPGHPWIAALESAP